MNRIRFIILFICSVSLFASDGQKISFDRLPSAEDLLFALDEKMPELNPILKLRDSGKIRPAISELVKYLKIRSAKRYYFSWENFNTRFNKYKNEYAQKFNKHRSMANYHISTFAPETKWILPFRDLKGRDVTAYELRHLSRQQKSADMTLMFYYESQKSENLNYFVRQVADLNRAFTDGKYDTKGNAVYEVFRAGKRIHNWLFNYNAYLASPAFTSEAQVNLIRTFLHHGAQLYKRSQRYRYGNHQTKGLVALFEISTLFPEFADSDKWRQLAIDGLVWHIKNEINEDGFQFERSVHYHMGDIENYFRVYQLAQINQIELPEIFTTQFKKMFTALISIAQPNKRLPVLQDDTDDPYAENNDISGVMTVGTLLFEDPNFRYFAGNEIPASIYWLLAKEQLNTLDQVISEIPQIGSTALDATGYYCMRGGWAENDLCMTISSGLSEHKPDHQHADMLGLVAYANGHEILPNYQTRYKHPEYRHFKNSWVKNVALADSFVQGQNWKQNSGKSGFGKWLDLPEPQVLSWITGDSFDYFNGCHNGFKSLNIEYNREVLFIKNKFWLVRDTFASSSPHQYQQVWQGKYQTNSTNTATKTYVDGTGLYIRQLNSKTMEQLSGGGLRDKYNLVFQKKADAGFTFSTLLIPFAEASDKDVENSWEVNNVTGSELEFEAGLTLSLGNEIFLFDLSKLIYNEKSWEFENPVSVHMLRNDTGHSLNLLSEAEVGLSEHANDIETKKMIKSGIIENF